MKRKKCVCEREREGDGWTGIKTDSSYDDCDDDVMRTRINAREPTNKRVSKRVYAPKMWHFFFFFFLFFCFNAMSLIN